ncbi:MAG TPA: methyltransferase [Candidatus Mcinerneyibacteriales bacterium]|nr:methyltransferase [Candidatus Mcinerneyibacteriales bacterium]
MWPKRFPASEYDETAVGGLKLLQPRKGFRISHDSLLLYISLPPGSSSVLDIGSGCGVISLLYAGDNPSSCVTGIDILEKNRNLAYENAARNGLSRVRFLEGDVRDYREKEPFELIFSNPPYRKAGSGRLSPSKDKNIALYDTHLDFQSLLLAAKRLLSPQGLFFMVIWEGRREEMIEKAAEASLFPVVEMTYRGEKTSHHSFVVTGFSHDKKGVRRVSMDFDEWSQKVRILMLREVMKGENHEKM